MLVVEQPGGAVLAIAQPVHAAFAGVLAQAWDDDLPPGLPEAATHHDDVWAASDAAPRWNPDTARPYGFPELAPAERVAVWSQAPALAAPLGRGAELWVLRHAERLHANAQDPDLQAMAAGFAVRIAELVQELRASPEGVGLDDFALRRGTSLLALFDSLSLACCFGVDAPQPVGVLALAPAAEGAVSVTPWPFVGARLEGSVVGRELPGVLGDQASLDEAWAAAPRRTIAITLVPG